MKHFKTKNVHEELHFGIKFYKYKNTHSMITCISPTKQVSSGQGQNYKCDNYISNINLFLKMLQSVSYKIFNN